MCTLIGEIGTEKPRGEREATSRTGRVAAQGRTAESVDPEMGSRLFCVPSFYFGYLE